jgi:hypothetical protein
MKLLFFDIDGTLADLGHVPSPATVETIRACRANGHKVFLSTGRTLNMVPEAIAAIGFDGGIYSAGGRILVDGQELQRNHMPPELVKWITDVMEEKRIYYTMECDDCLFEGSTPLEANETDTAKGSSELQRFFEQRKKLGRRYPISEYQGTPVYKISYMVTSYDQIEELKNELGKEAKVVGFDNLMPGVPFIGGEISDFAINKGAALEFLCDYYGVNVSQSVAFGDSMNDSEILEAAGIGIAMGNSSEEVKKLADRVCPSCEEDGVAKTLIELGLA